MSQYIMHDTLTGDGVMKSCTAMGKRPKVRQMEPGQARAQYGARQCPVCMPFKVTGPVVVERRET